VLGEKPPAVKRIGKLLESGLGGASFTVGVTRLYLDID